MDSPASDSELPSHPGARRPDRSRQVWSHGVRLAVWEWGDCQARPLLLAHGGFDFAGTFDVFAPLLAEAGFRVVSWDHRGHGDSDHVELYTWGADLRDALAVLDSTSSRPLALVGHSKGGSMLTDLAGARPQRVTQLVNLEGLPSPRPHPDVAEHERTALRHEEIAGWLDHRRRAADLVRKPGTREELARRRQRMNPRLSLEWLRYLVGIGARRDPDGWRWKIDPSLRFGGFGPWRPEWALERLRELAVPFLGVLGMMPEEMGWGTDPDRVRRLLPATARLEVFDDLGHFVHIEQPRAIADLVIEFLS
jgi:pimeloyl-ACP methyl ester carboxylesterase